MSPRNSLILCGFLPGSSCPDDGAFHRVVMPEGQRLESLAGGGFGWAFAIGADAADEKRKTLYSWGRPPFPSSSPSSGTDGVLLAAAGYDHAVFSKKSDDGSLWFCGWAAGAFGGGRGGGAAAATTSKEERGPSSYVTSWTRLPLPPAPPSSSGDSPPASHVSALACGFDRTLALTFSAEGGQLWEWGAAGEGEAEAERGGAGRAAEEGGASPPLPLPRLVPFPRGGGERTRITSISAGAHHCAAVDSRGALWTWGGNLRGQCGVVVSPSPCSSRGEESKGTPPPSLAVRVPAPTRNATLGGVRLAAVAAGGSHTLVLCEAGSLFGFGANGSGQLGLLAVGGGGGAGGGGEAEEREPPSSTRVPTPVAVASSPSSPPPSFSSISAGATHSLALAEDGREVFVLGRVSPSGASPSPSGGGVGVGVGSSPHPPPPFCPPRRAALPAGARAAAVASGWWHAMISLVEGEEEEGEEAGAPEGEREGEVGASGRRAAKRRKEL